MLPIKLSKTAVMSILVKTHGYNCVYVKEYKWKLNVLLVAKLENKQSKKGRHFQWSTDIIQTNNLSLPVGTQKSVFIL